MKRRGAALIVVLACLALLAMLALAFSTATSVERNVARNHLLGARARLLASSGVETALARLRELAQTGELFDGRPWDRAWTERVGGGEIEIRIVDAQAKIHLNDGLAWGPDHAVSRNLARVLDLLGARLRVPGLGAKILKARPPAGYVSVHDLLAVLDGDREAFERVRTSVSVRAWSDPDVANPVPFSAETGGDFPSSVRYDRPAAASGPVYRFGHQHNAKGEPIRRPLRLFDPADPSPNHHAVWGRDSLNPRWIEIVARAPVNVNAASRDVLIALLGDLEGAFLVERRRGMGPGGPASPCGSPGAAYGWTSLRYSYDGEGDEAGLLYRSAPIPAEAVADALIAARPFRSWRQFHAFCDGLVEKGVLKETRTERYWDVDVSGRRVPSAAQLRRASQAMADVLKANFDPNLHLNEINPDAALFTQVDKTDLLVSSTEFCFGPMGVFEIESTGRIEGAVAGVEATVKTFDVLRHTHQKHFAGGASGPRAGDLETNGEKAVESGPEVDNGPAPAENEYEGWLRPATIGGAGLPKPAGELRSTLSDPALCPGASTSAPGGPHLGAGMHAHFDLDHAAHHHAGRTYPGLDLVRLPQGAWQAATKWRCALARNWADRGEELPGPYGPVDAGRSGKSYRLARSFRIPPGGRAPEVEDEAPSDLRVDGAYAERDAAFGYWIDENESFNINEGTIAFWIKPAFDPQATGKRRTLLSAGRWHETAPDFMNPSPFALYHVPPYSDEADLFPSYGSGRLRPGALAFGFGFSPKTGYNAEFDPALGPAGAHAYAFTPTLAPALFRAGRWTHVAVTWKIPRGRSLPADAARVYVDGRLLPGSETVRHRFEGDEGQPFLNTPWWSLHSLQVETPAGPRWVKNLLRVGGETSLLFDVPGGLGLVPGNFSADATIDELYVWLNASASRLKSHYVRGRYYAGAASFTSGPMDVRRPLALAWSSRGGPVELSVDGAALPDEGGSLLSGEGPVRWTATFIPGADPLAPAVLDDVTLFHDPGAPTILGWVATGGRR